MRPSLLVTGASGLLGVSLVAAARRRGWRVMAWYRRSRIRVPDGGAQQVDLRDAAAVREALMLARPDWIVHAAAATSVDWCESHPEQAYEVNARASGQLVTLAATAGARVVYVSTDSVFDGVCGGYAEDDEARPVNVYALTKLQGEELVRAAMPSALTLRTTLYGWNYENKQSLAEWILGRLKSGKEIRGFHDVVFCPLLANHLADLILALVDREAAGTFHVVGGEPCSKYEFARRLAAAYGYNPDLVQRTSIRDVKLRARRPLNTTLVTRKVAGLLGRAMPDVDTGLAAFHSLESDGFVKDLRALYGG